MRIPSLREVVSEQEWQLRCDLAACYRLVAAHGWTDLIFTHLTARLPGPDHHFLINPYGLAFDEITASSLVKLDLPGTGGAQGVESRWHLSPAPSRALLWSDEESFTLTRLRARLLPPAGWSLRTRPKTEELEPRTLPDP